jgi:hypothetical protein
MFRFILTLPPPSCQQFCGLSGAYPRCQFVYAFTWREWLNYQLRRSSDDKMDSVFRLPSNESDAHC